MISNIRKILNTKVVILKEEQKKVLFDILFKVLRSNIFIFLCFGIVITVIDWNRTNWDNLYSSYRIDFIYLIIIFTLCYFIPFFVAIILNLIIKFSKNEKIKKVFKIIMIITNIISILYLSLVAYLICNFALPPQS